MIGGGEEKWRHWFCRAILQWHMAPDQFWQLSVLEWGWLLSAMLGDAQDTLNRQSLNALLKHYPDEKNDRPCEDQSR